MSEARTLAETVLDLCRRRRWKLATAESCTGGMVAAALTDIAGSSDVVERGFVTYSNEAKTDLLGVPTTLIAQHGDGEREVARAIGGGRARPRAGRSPVSITGVADRWRQRSEAGGLSISARRGRRPNPRRALCF